VDAVYVDDTELTGNGYVGKSEDLYAARSVDETRHIVHELIASKVKTICILQDQLQVEQEARRAEMPEHHNRSAVARMRAHLAGAASEPGAAQRFLEPQTGDEAEPGVVRAEANAKLCVGDGLETLRLVIRGCGG
jgi:hypothetical protein